MASGSLASELALPRERTGAESFLRLSAKLMAGLSVLALALHLGVMLWAQNEFTQPESIVAAQSTMLAQTGSFYPTLKDYPYTVNAYMPVYYLFEAGLFKMGLPVVLGGRLLSFASFLGVLFLVWKTVLLYTSSRPAAYFGLLLCSTTCILWQWASTGQVDMLGAFFSIASFYFFSRHWVNGDNTILIASALALDALLVKQTFVAAPAAIFALLLMKNWRTAMRFGIPLVVTLAGVVYALNVWTHGGFLANTVFGNIFPFAWDKLKQHTDYMQLFTGQLILVAAICAAKVWRTPARALLVYLGFAASVLAGTAAKVGSDSNYQIETTVLLAMTCAAGLHAVDFFPRFFSRDKAWITLLHLPLGIHMVLNVRLMYPTLLGRVANEQAFRQQMLELSPLVGDGRAILSDVNAALRLRGALEVEPLVYTILAEGGQIDPEPLRKDIAAEKFATLVLYTDVSKQQQVDPEIPRLTDAQHEEVGRHYRLEKHVAGPYREGVFVYKPKGEAR